MIALLKPYKSIYCQKGNKISFPLIDVFCVYFDPSSFLGQKTEKIHLSKLGLNFLKMSNDINIQWLSYESTHNSAGECVSEF